MSSTPRRGGFRLPWSSEEPTPEPDGGQTPGETAGAEAAATHTPDEAPVAESQAPAAQPAEPPSGAAGDEPQPGPAAEESSEFLSSLVSAMRDVADEARRTTVEQLRHDLEARVSELKERAGKQAEELHRSSDADLAAVAKWEEAEIERIRAESARRAEARRQQLAEQMADNEHRTDSAMELLRARVSEYERELDRFFADLGSIADPAAFVAAAKRMPRSPVLPTQAPAPVTPTPSAPTPAAPRPPDAASPEATRRPRGETPADEPATAEAAAAPAPPIGQDAGPNEGPAATEAGETADLPSASAEADRDAALEARLAALDASLAATGAASQPADSAANGSSDASTSVVVKGLGSFGAITTFKQSIERLAGVRSVALSLGPTGEFVYRATHDPAYDLSEALRALEPSADVEREPDGTVRLTITRTR